MKNLKYILQLFLVLFCVESFGQQEWLFTQSAFNLYDNNAAYAGSYKELNIGLRTRYQWLGIEGAPTSQMVSIHTPVFQNVGTGIRLHNETIGARNRMKAVGTVSYKLPMRNGYFGVAFNGGILSQNFNKNLLFSKTDIDNVLLHDENGTTVIVDFAAMWYSKKFYLGVEIQNINEPSFYPGEFTRFGQKRFYNVMGAYGFKLGTNHILKPGFTYRFNLPMQSSFEGRISWFIHKKLWLGAGYRTNFGALAFLEWNITDRFRFGYSYDHSINDLGTLAPSTHELFLGIRIIKEQQKGTSIRYFK